MTPYLPHPARIVARHAETADMATFTLRFIEPAQEDAYRFSLGQFNMLTAFGVGEVPISIVSDPDEPARIVHTIRAAGRVTGVMLRWKVGDIVGVRGPYGVGWPMTEARGRDVVIVTGGLGCAPVVGVINYIFRRRDEFGTLHILHGVRTAHDLLYREQFERWRSHPRTRVYLTSDQPDREWHYRVGVVTELFDELAVDGSTVPMLCGPEVMMQAAIRALRTKGVAEDAIYLSLERNMQCAVGLCGHCQIGPLFCCTDGPVFRCDAVRRWLAVPGV